MGKRRPKSKKANKPQKPVVIEQLNINLPPASKEGNWWKRSIISLASLSISLITLLFGNSLLLRFINSPVPPIANVSVVGTDTTTKGNWRGVYGSEGYAVPGEVRITKPLKVEILSLANGSTFTVGDMVPIVARDTVAAGAKVTGVCRSPC
jgi:hypothetical protein